MGKKWCISKYHIIICYYFHESLVLLQVCVLFKLRKSVILTLLQLVSSSCDGFKKSLCTIYYYEVIFVWSSVIMDGMMFWFKNLDPLKLYGTWIILAFFSLPFTTNRTEAAIFHTQAFLIEDFSSDTSIVNHNMKKNVGHVYCINKISMVSSSTGVLPILTRERCLVNCPPWYTIISVEKRRYINQPTTQLINQNMCGCTSIAKSSFHIDTAEFSTIPLPVSF